MHGMHKPGTAARRAGELTARQVASIVLGFAALRHHPGHALLAACAAQAAERVTEATAQGLENTLRGFANLQFNPGDALLRAYEAAAVRHAEEFIPQAVVRVDSQCTCVDPQIDGNGPLDRQSKRQTAVAPGSLPYM